MKKGKVNSYNPAKGFGFIYGDDGNSYFAHCSNIVGRAECRLYVGEYVQFEVIKSRNPNHKNDQAINISSIENINNEEPCYIYTNPFSPRNPINDPEKFAGRKHGIKEGVSALINNSNILITGDRGIGKSSFANQLIYIAKGEKYLLNKAQIHLPDSEELDFATISIRGFKEMSINDFAERIIRELLAKFNIDSKFEKQHEIDLKIYKFKAKSLTKDKQFENVLDFFGYDLIKLTDLLPNKDGVLILVDEIENIDPNVGFANFIKNITEYFQAERKKITFILSGIPCSLTNLFFQHASFFRLFTPIELKEFSPIESYELIDTYLSGRAKRIDPKTRTTMTNVAKGYPVNLQLIGFYSYQVDTDSNINDYDMRSAIDYIIENVKRDEFLNKHESIGFGLSEKIFKFVLTQNNGVNISFEKLLKVFKHIDKDEILAAVEKLEKNELIYKYSKGNYFIKDYLFYRYLQKHYGIRNIDQ